MCSLMRNTLNDRSGKRRRNSVQCHVLSRVQEHLLKSLFSIPRTNKDSPRFLLHLRSSARSLWTHIYIFSYSLKRNSIVNHFSYLIQSILNYCSCKRILLRRDILCEELMNVWHWKNDWKKFCEYYWFYEFLLQLHNTWLFIWTHKYIW